MLWSAKPGASQHLSTRVGWLVRKRSSVGSCRIWKSTFCSRPVVNTNQKFLVDNHLVWVPHIAPSFPVYFWKVQISTHPDYGFPEFGSDGLKWWAQMFHIFSWWTWGMYRAPMISRLPFSKVSVAYMDSVSLTTLSCSLMASVRTAINTPPPIVPFLSFLYTL